MTATLIIWLTWRYIHTYWLPRIEVNTTKKLLQCQGQETGSMLMKVRSPKIGNVYLSAHAIRY